MWKNSDKSTQAAWFTIPEAARYSGLSTALLYELIKEDCIVSSTVLRPGRRRGRRLVQRASIDSFIEAGVGKSSADNLRGGAAPDAQKGVDSNGKKGGGRRMSDSVQSRQDLVIERDAPASEHPARPEQGNPAIAEMAAVKPDSSAPPIHKPDLSYLLRKLPRKLRLELDGAPVSGAGVHQWIFTAALKLHHCRMLSDDDRAALLGWAVRDCGREVPQSEIDDAVRNSGRLSQGSRQQQESDRRTESMRETGRRTGWSDLSVELRERVLTSCPFSVAQLRQLSPVTTGQPHQDSGWYVDQLFPGDPLLCVGTSPAMCCTMPLSGIKRRYKLEAHALIVPSPMCALSGTNQQGKRSTRCLDNTGPRRFLVTEFDSGTLDEHASLIVHLKTLGSLVMVLWSGSKSLHAWWNAHDVAEEDLRRFFQYAVSLGADPATWPRCQLVRLPEGRRGVEMTRQAVYYFDPGSLPLSDHSEEEVSP